MIIDAAGSGHASLGDKRETRRAVGLVARGERKQRRVEGFEVDGEAEGDKKERKKENGEK